MTPEQFHEWRKSLHLTQAEAAQRLGVSKRSIFTYEGSGPVPQVVALACEAISRTLNKVNLELVVREQHPKLGEFVLIIPFVIERESSFADTLVVTLSEEARDWVKENTPSAVLSIKTVITTDMKRQHVPVIAFDSSEEAVFFRIRWC